MELLVYQKRALSEQENRARAADRVLIGCCQEEVFKRREEGLKRKDLELQESLIRFSKFLQENDSKRSRAEKKASDEIKLRLQKEKEIDGLRNTLEDLQIEKEKVHDILEKNMRWHALQSIHSAFCRGSQICPITLHCIFTIPVFSWFVQYKL